MKVDESFIPGARVCLGAEIVHGDTNVITELSTKYKWPISQSFTWAHGDGGPSKKEAPDGGAGYYYIGGLKKWVAPPVPVPNPAPAVCPFPPLGPHTAWLWCVPCCTAARCVAQPRPGPHRGWWRAVASG